HLVELLDGRRGVCGRDEAVDRVGRKDDRLASPDCFDGVVHRLPSTTRSTPARSGVIVTAPYPAAVSTPATSSACSSPTSSTRNRVRAVCAIRAWNPSPRSALVGS